MVGPMKASESPEITCRRSMDQFRWNHHWNYHKIFSSPLLGYLVFGIIQIIVFLVFYYSFLHLVAKPYDHEKPSLRSYCHGVDFFVESFSVLSTRPSNVSDIALNVSFRIKNPNCLVSSVSFPYGLEVQLHLKEKLFMATNVQPFEVGEDDEVTVQATFNSSSSTSLLMPIREMQNMDVVLVDWQSMNFELEVHTSVRETYFRALRWMRVSCGDVKTLINNTDHGSCKCQSSLATSSSDI